MGVGGVTYRTKPLLLSSGKNKVLILALTSSQRAVLTTGMDALVVGILARYSSDGTSNLKGEQVGAGTLPGLKGVKLRGRGGRVRVVVVVGGGGGRERESCNKCDTD